MTVDKVQYFVTKRPLLYFHVWQLYTALVLRL